MTTLQNDLERFRSKIAVDIDPVAAYVWNEFYRAWHSLGTVAYMVSDDLVHTTDQFASERRIRYRYAIAYYIGHDHGVSL